MGKTTHPETWDSQRTYLRADRAIAAGQLWRAKEILRGNIASQPYDFRLYERYGQLLLQLGDLEEAGKYLFLSGERRPEYQQAIQLFRYRHGRRDPYSLYHDFPRRARFEDLERYPPAVQADLRGLRIDRVDWRARYRQSAPQPGARRDWVLPVLLVGALGLFLLGSLVVGFVVISREVASFISRL